MAEEEILQDIERLEARLQFLEGDRTRWVMPWAGDPGYQPYDRGPYLRKLEKRKLRAKLRRRRGRLTLLRSRRARRERTLSC